MRRCFAESHRCPADWHVQAVLLGERITGEGFVQQLDLATNIPIWEQEPIVGLLVVGLLIGGLYPNKQVLGAGPTLPPFPSSRV